MGRKKEKETKNSEIKGCGERERTEKSKRKSEERGLPDGLLCFGLLGPGCQLLLIVLGDVLLPALHAKLKLDLLLLGNNNFNVTHGIVFVIMIMCVQRGGVKGIMRRSLRGVEPLAIESISNSFLILFHNLRSELISCFASVMKRNSCVISLGWLVSLS